MLVCYLNPRSFGRYRAFFTQSGFRVVDCPPLTWSGKTSADIYMVLDIIDTLAHPVRYEEFVVASADADFTPVVQRLRAHDRRTTVVAAGRSSTAYRSTCDVLISPDQFVDVLLGTFVEESEAPAHIEEPHADISEEDVARAVAAVRARVALETKPLMLPAAAQEAHRASSSLGSSHWAGTRSFRAFLQRFAPELVIATSPSPGYLYDPSRHSPADLPGDGSGLADLGATATRVARVTGAPAIPRETYARLFQELARALGDDCARNELSKVVRDRTLEDGPRISRGAANFVVQGLIFSGYGLPKEATAETLSQAFLDNVLGLCSSAQLDLSPSERADVAKWIGAPVTPP
jgi:hypothetical protein